MHKTTCETNQSFTFNILAQTCATGAENDNSCSRQIEVVNIVHCNEHVLLLAVLIDRREKYPRQPRMLAVDEGMSGEVHNLKLLELWVEKSCSISREVR